MASVLHLGKYYPPDFGGIETVTQQLARGAALAGHDVSVLCFHTGRRALSTSSDQDVRVIRLPRQLHVASQPLGLHYCTTALREGRVADIVHIHWPNLLAAACALALPRRCKIVVHWHSDIVGKGLLGRLTRPLAQALLRRCELAIATSSNYANASPYLQRHSTKVAISPIGIDDWTERKPPDAPGVCLPKPMLEWLAGRRIVLAVGRLVPYKGFDVLIRAARRLPVDAAVVIVGDGLLRTELTATIAAEQLGARVLIAGRLEEGALRALFYRCALFCLPSIERSEAFGVVLLEAMAAGVPIVATSIPGSGVPWVNHDGFTGTNVTPGDDEALAHACLQILESKLLRDKFARNARDRFVREFDSRVTSSQVLDLYAGLLANDVQGLLARSGNR